MFVVGEIYSLLGSATINLAELAWPGPWFHIWSPRVASPAITWFLECNKSLTACTCDGFRDGFDHRDTCTRAFINEEIAVVPEFTTGITVSEGSNRNWPQVDLWLKFSEAPQLRRPTWQIVGIRIRCIVWHGIAILGIWRPLIAVGIIVEPKEAYIQFSCIYLRQGEF